MYRRKIPGQMKFEIPFGVELDADNRWVKLASIMPWDDIEQLYVQNFKGSNGQVAKSSRLALAALYMQNRLVLTDVETVEQISENPSMQYFCGFEAYTTNKPFDSSLMVHFRKRISAEMMKEISEAAFAAEAKKSIEEEKNDDDDNDNSGSGNSESEPQGTLLLDATCCPSDIHYPTDIGLLNHARELTEIIIDELHQQAPRGTLKPRTYRDVARKAYLSYSKKRKHSYGELQFSIGQQLRYVRRNLHSIAKQVDHGANLGSLNKILYRKLLVISEVYRQQKLMYDEKTHKIEGRIVSISQPHLRPIVIGGCKGIGTQAALSGELQA